MKCCVCGIELKRLGSHIVKKHNLTLQQYYDTYLKKDGEDICECGKKKKFNRDLNEAYNDFCSQTCAVKNKEIQKKMRKTCFINHGVDNPLMSYDLKKDGMIKKYGEETPIRVESIQKRRIATLIERYNVDHPSKIESVKNQKIKTQILHFGDLYCRTENARRSARENFIKNIELQHGEYKVQIGKNEIEIIDEISKISDILIEKSFRVIGYVLDGYIKELNIAIEIDEYHHSNACYVERDIIRQEEIEKFLGCTFIRINEIEWIKDKNLVYNQIKMIITEHRERLNK